MTCQHCAKAAIGNWGGRQEACPGCQLRRVLRSPEYFESKRTKKLTPGYEQALKKFGLKHEDVKAADVARHIGSTSERQP